MIRSSKRFSAGVPKWPKGQVNFMEGNAVFFDGIGCNESLVMKAEVFSIGSARLKAISDGRKSCVLVTSRVRLPPPAYLPFFFLPNKEKVQVAQKERRNDYD